MTSTRSACARTCFRCGCHPAFFWHTAISRASVPIRSHRRGSTAASNASCLCLDSSQSVQSCELAAASPLDPKYLASPIVSCGRGMSWLSCRRCALRVNLNPSPQKLQKLHAIMVLALSCLLMVALTFVAQAKQQRREWYHDGLPTCQLASDTFLSVSWQQHC